MKFYDGFSDGDEFTDVLIGKVTDVLCRLIEIFMDTIGPYLDIFELLGDDYAAQNPIISPRMFDRFFSPAWKRMISLVKEASPNC